VATTEELSEAFADWRARSNDNPRLAKMVKGWDRVIHFTTTDTAQGFTMRVEAQRLSELVVGHEGQPDVIVTGSSEEITLAGSQTDVMRIDAISMVAFLDQ